MICSLNCFCDFVEAQSPERQASVVRRYKRGASAPVKGMVVYYRPALRAMRGRLADGGSEGEMFAALREACLIKSWPDKLVEARVEANVHAYRVFRQEFGNKKLRIFSNPRMQYLVSPDLAINLQPEFYAEVDGQVMMWKIGMTKKKRSEKTIRSILQMLLNASQRKGLDLTIRQIRFLDVRTGKIYIENAADPNLNNRLAPTARALAEAWNAAA